MKKKTKWKKAINTIALGAIGSVVGFASPCNGDEILDFTGIGPNDSGIPDTYGDNLATTPNIGLTWNDPNDSTLTDGWDSYPGWDGRGDVGQTNYSESNPMSVFFTPDSGFGVFVTSFDLDEWTGGGNSVVDWALLEGGTTLFSGTWDDFSDANAGNGGRSQVTTGMDASSAAYGELELRLTLVSGFHTYQALDNLAFGQVTAIPEPTSAALLGLGFGTLLMRRKRREN